MIRKALFIVILCLMMSSQLLPQASISRTQTLTQESVTVPSETNLGRVTWTTNTFPNVGLEEWYNPHSPEDIYTVRTTEEASWYETSNVYEGAKSFGMHARALDPSHYSEVRLTQQSWIYWDNPTNTTLDFDWYLDSIGTPINQDYYQVRLRISNRDMYYYIGCQNSVVMNGSMAYFFINGPLQTWNHLHRNLTSDYFEVFGQLPTEFEWAEWWIRSYSTTYTRIYMDDVNIVNGTFVKVGGSTLNGNFEGTGGWTFQTSTDPADISQSPVRKEGDWSMNMTVLSNDYTSYAYASYNPNKLLSESNKGQLSFWWMIEDWVNPDVFSYCRLIVNVKNSTTDFQIYYFFAIGGAGTMPMVIMDNTIKIKVDSFNATGTWNRFDRNIWEDFTGVYDTENLWIDEIEFQVRTTVDNSLLSLLFDDIQFETAILNDMNYEHQDAVGSPILGWDYTSGLDDVTVTDFAKSGNKAANLTLNNDESCGYDQTIGKLVLNSSTELILDFNVYIDDFNLTSEDYLLFALSVQDTSMYYIIANSTSAFESSLGEEGGDFILLQDTITTNQWLNFQIDIVHDYEDLFGNAPDTTLTYLYLSARSGPASRLSVIFDDLYIYCDPAPDVIDVDHLIILAPGGGPGYAIINATAIDATLESVVLNYRVDNGTWQQVDMNQLDTTLFEANITNLVGDLTVEYSITATDAFDKTFTALNGTEYFSFTLSTGTLPTGDLLGPILILGVIIAIGVVLLVYVFVYKRK
ncbi:MAG: hypothetical protein JW779_15500 [Candidatus Thorarchaeota archaeon]|nr:hypothetical protein [Candidatus Thorarchaeota archaeon]